MKLSRRTNTIILWLISIGLLVSMVIAFTPTLNGLFGSNSAQPDNATALTVNGRDVTELDVARAQQNVPFRSGLEGVAAEDVDLLITDQLVTNAVLREASQDIRVTNGEVRTALNDWRQEQGLGGSSNDRNYINFIGRLGYTDQTFRDFWREQLKQEKYQESLTEGVEVSDAEAQAYYELNEESYQAEDRIIARQIVVDDAELAEDLLAQAQDGADFSELAAENSLELADANGAIGAAADSTEPQAVGRPALPTPVANAAFGLGGAGLSDVIESGGRFYIVNVEDFVPGGTRPFEEVADEVREDALEAKESQVLEERFEELLDSAEVNIPEGSELNYTDSVVARVGDYEIENSDLVRVVYSDPQISQAITPDTAQVITDLFKPNYLQQLIDSELAYQGAQTLDVDFFGPRALVAQNALAYVSRDASASDEELQTYYDENEAQFTVPASALITRVDFDSRDAASAFRDALLDGGDLTETAESEGGTVSDLGTVNPGSLSAELDNAIFSGDTFDDLPESDLGVSDVLVIEELVEDTAEEDAVEGDAAEEEVAEETDTDAELSEEVAEIEAEANAEVTDEEVTDEEVTDEDADVETADDVLEDLTSTEDEVVVEETNDEASEDAEADVTDEDAAADEDATDETVTDEAVTEEAESEGELTQTFSVLVGSTTPEELRPFDEVRAQVEQSVLNEKRNELQTEWLDGLRETTEIENLLASAEPPAPTLDGEPVEGAEDSDAPAEAPTEDVPAEDVTGEDSATEDVGEDETLEDADITEDSEESTTEDSATSDEVTEDETTEEPTEDEAAPDDTDEEAEDTEDTN